MSDPTEVQSGDLVRVTLEGYVTDDLRLATRPYDLVNRGVHINNSLAKSVEVLQRARLRLGDVVTHDNADRLPDRYILSDGDGSPWTRFPKEYKRGSNLEPFTLIYIH